MQKIKKELKELYMVREGVRVKTKIKGLVGGKSQGKGWRRI